MNGEMSSEFSFDFSSIQYVVLPDSDPIFSSIPLGCSAYHLSEGKIFVRESEWPGVERELNKLKTKEH